MSTQEVAELIDSVNEMTQTVANKTKEIDQRVDLAEQEFDAFKQEADALYLNVVGATSSNHKLKNVNFGDWEYGTNSISPTKGFNALILAKKVPLSVDPAVRGDMAMIGTINALRVHGGKILQVSRFSFKYFESYTARSMSIIADDFNSVGDWEIREVLLPSLDPSIPYYVLSRTASLDTSPNQHGFGGKMTFDGVYGFEAGNYIDQGQYEHTGTAILLSDCGYTV